MVGFCAGLYGFRFWVIKLPRFASHEPTVTTALAGSVLLCPTGRLLNPIVNIITLIVITLNPQPIVSDA